MGIKTRRASRAQRVRDAPTWMNQAVKAKDLRRLRLGVNRALARLKHAERGAGFLLGKEKSVFYNLTENESATFNALTKAYVAEYTARVAALDRALRAVKRVRKRRKGRGNAV